MQKIPSGSHNSLGPTERYHAPLRTIYNKIKNETPDLGNEVELSIAVHAMNCTANPEGLIPILFVFGAVAKIPLGNIEHFSPNQRKRFAAMESSKKEMERIVVSRRLKVAKKLRTKRMKLFYINPGSKVKVYGEKQKKFGPFMLQWYDNYKTAYINFGESIVPFSILL